MLASTAYAQQRTVTGAVKDGGTGEALPGVNVVIKGSSKGTITDIDGKFSLAVESDQDVLIFSFIGYVKEEIPVNGQTSVDVNLTPDVTSLQEVVVVGYGEQKKVVATGAISGVKASDLESMPVNRIEQSLQGRTSGLTIAAGSGQPGSSATVRVRGITTINNNDPLWVVDGVIVDNGGIGFLNQSDIESIDVLKDAASQAIYGARAAAGVILVTTKKGKSGKLTVNYNGYLGTSAPAHKLDLLNATEYATLRNEAAIANSANQTVPFANPESLGKGTDWQATIFNNSARRQNHELSLSGGSEKSTFYASFGHLDQEGIVATDISRYRRTNIRLNSTHKLSDYVSFGQTLGYASTKSVGLGNTNSEFGGPLSSAIHLDPITPAVITDPVEALAPIYANNNVMRDELGRPYGISSIVGQEMSNPLAFIKLNQGNYGWAHDFVGNTYLTVEPIKNLKIKTSLGAKLAFWGGERYTPKFLLSPTIYGLRSSMYREQNRVFNWNIENTISYTRSFDKHHANILLGQGAYLDDNSVSSNVTFFDLPFTSFSDATFNYNNGDAANRAGGAGDGVPHKVTSLFARATYDFDEKYLFTAIIRRDGSSRFGANYRFGVFPSFSAGWVASKESFFPTNNVVTFFKIRGGYGVVGNDNIGNFRFLPLVSPGRNYAISGSNSLAIGVSPRSPANPDLRWEETSQTNIGFEANLLNDITLSFDWYRKKTTGMLEYPYLPGYVGAVENPAANVGDMENKGIEIELGYKRNINDLTLSFNGNFSYVQNKVLYLGNGIPFRDRETFHTMNGNITRIQPGHPMNAYYGYKTNGIFQTWDEVNAYTNAEGELIQPNAAPGDFIWSDLNNDGEITTDDRTFIGDPTPNVTYGLTVTANWKGIDFTVFGQGVAGNQIFQGLRRLDIGNANWQSAALGRWTGPGTSNSHPRIVDGDPNENFGKNSNFYLEDGDYFRLKVVQLGYTLPATLTSKASINRVRVYVMAENLLTFTKYTGYDPEIGGSVMSIDRGIYPQARSFMVGLNVGL